MSSGGSVECSTAQTSPSSSWKQPTTATTKGHTNHASSTNDEANDTNQSHTNHTNPDTNITNHIHCADGNSSLTGELSFSKKHCFPRKQTSAFSSFTSSSSASSSSESTPVASVTSHGHSHHNHHPGALGDDHTRIQTPAALAAAATALARRAQGPSVQIGDKLPFEHPAGGARASGPAVSGAGGDGLTKSQSTVSLAMRRKYEPAQAVIRTASTSPEQPHEPRKPFELSFKKDQYYRSEEELRQAAARRCNYSLPTSPTGSHYSWMVMPKQVGCAPKTPLYLPAVLRRNGCGLEDEPHDAPATAVTDYFGLGGGGVSTAASSGTVSPVNGSTIPRAHWRPDSERQECAACQRQFTLFERRHHCRRCGDIFCREDSKYTVELDPSLSFNPLGGIKVRACCDCAAEYQEFKKAMVCQFSLQQLNSATPEAIAVVQNAQNNPDPVGSVPADWQWSTF
ncbi:hypothetical protein TRVA0_011S02168 [Trichomonascus vanleenenianus]|uniref:FYVE zinc finger domain-containing protein n=1 Tax=Trichomonascus vanleenenianus TaxID=2268995 RepID=UPI003ECB885D